ncbi:hypothetical protein [Nonomuraea sp. NPDC049784]|uniref:hypothetical protein n=1 Tax=Nonomuraea sp. NPDC049784 TaxID=3154361 RepID=UPI0034050E79
MTNEHTLRVCYVPSGIWPAEHATEIAEKNWVVVNAPRPLVGPRMWDGPFRCGIFYAAGPLTDDALVESWRRDDATLLTPVTGAEVAAKMRKKCEEEGYPLEEILADDLADCLAESLNLPWEKEWLPLLTCTYGTAVVAALAGDFPRLATPTTAEDIAAAIDRIYDKPATKVFEVILDHIGNWRLVADIRQLGLVRVTCCTFRESTAEQHAREDRLNALIRDL